MEQPLAVNAENSRAKGHNVGGDSSGNYRDGNSKDWKPLEWQGFYSLRRGIATQLTAITRDPMAANELLRHSSGNTTLAHYIKDVPEVTAEWRKSSSYLTSSMLASR